MDAPMANVLITMIICGSILLGLIVIMGYCVFTDLSNKKEREEKRKRELIKQDKEAGWNVDP